MSCNICCQSPCNCSQNLCGAQECEDPGVIPVGSFLQILDYKFCPRRLENSRGFVVVDNTPGGTPQVFITDAPCIEIPVLELGLGSEITHLNASLGDGACMRRLKPGDEVDGWLRAIGGVWQISALPSENLPDPFERENIIVTDTLTAENVVIGNSLCFDALAAGTITDNVGLNGSGCLVKGNISQIEAALYYESATLTSVATPNSPTARNTNAIIGNEIFDPQSIASIVSTTRIKIDKVGTYFIFWSGFFDRDPNNDSANGEPGLDLTINSSIVALSCGRAVRVNPPASAVIHGMHLAALAVNDTIDLKVNATANVTNNLLRDVKLILVRYRTT